MLPAILEAAQDLAPEQALSGEALRTLWTLLSALQPSVTAETGAGASTAVFSQISARHYAFTNDAESVTRLTVSPLVRSDTVRFVVGPSQRTLPATQLPKPLDAALLDGPHAYPFPELEYFHLYPQLRPGGLLVLDDLQIPTVRGLYRFLCRDEMFALDRRVGRTAFFRRTEAPTFSPWGDGWERQRANQRRVQVWRGRPGGALKRLKRWVANHRISIDNPNCAVESETTISGSANLAADSDLWVLTRREGQGGWWPQGAGPVACSVDGRWRVSARFGDARDAGARFELLGVAVGALTTARWRAWLRAGEDHRPVQLPPDDYIHARRLVRVSRRAEAGRRRL